MSAPSGTRFIRFGSPDCLQPPEAPSRKNVLPKLANEWPNPSKSFVNLMRNLPESSRKGEHFEGQNRLFQRVNFSRAPAARIDPTSQYDKVVFARIPTIEGLKCRKTRIERNESVIDREPDRTSAQAGSR